MSNQAGPDLVPERDAAVGIEQVRMVVVDQFLDPFKPLLLPARVLAVPAGVLLLGREVIQVLILRIGAVIGDARPEPRSCPLRDWAETR